MVKKRNLKVLIIDDDPEIIGVVRMMVKMENHESLEALDGDEGIRLARGEKPDVILLDIMMSSIDGFEVLRKLGEDKKTRSIPVIFVSGKTSHSDIERGLSLGAYGYVTKPFHPSSLMKLIYDAVEKPPGP